jgi:hypothetical protein
MTDQSVFMTQFSNALATRATTTSLVRPRRARPTLGDRGAAILTVLRTPLGSLRTPGFAGPSAFRTSSNVFRRPQWHVQPCPYKPETLAPFFSTGRFAGLPAVD